MALLGPPRPGADAQGPAAREGLETTAAHDWLEVTGLTELELPPVELLEPDELVPAELEAPDEPTPVDEFPELPLSPESPELDAPEFPDVPVEPDVPAEPDVLVAPLLLLLSAALELASWRERAGSWPVISTTAISDHSTRNSATEPPITLVRILRTRALRFSRICPASAGVMSGSLRRPRSTGVWNV